MSSKVKQKNKIWPALVVIGIVTYIAIDILLAFLKPEVSLLHNAESDYGRGPYFWVMDFNFLLRCGLSLALVKAIWDTFSENKPIKKASYWIASWAIASGLLVFFADNPPGYPYLKSGSIHSLLAVVVFVSAIVGMILLDRRLRSVQIIWDNTVTLLIGVTILAFMALALLSFSHIRIHSLGGLYERVFLGLVLLWEGIIAIKILEINKTPK
jgi:uncharacterized protein DUF998